METDLGARRRWVAILALSCGNCVIAVDTSMINVALPTIAQDFHVPLSAAAMVVSIYQLVLLMTVLPLAALAEKYGLRRSYLTGLTVFACAGVGSALAPNLPVLIVMRALQAIGGAAIISVSPGLIRHTYPADRLGSGLGLNSLIVSGAAMLAPAFGGAVLAFAAWRWIFVIVLPLALIAVALGRALPRTDRHSDPYDFPAAAMSAATFLLVIGGVQFAIHGGGRLLCGAAVLAGLVLGVIFMRREKRSLRPVLPIDMLGTRVIALSVLGGFCVHAGSQSIMLVLPFQLEHNYGYTPVEVGSLLVAWTLAMAVTVFVSGRLSNKGPDGLLGVIGMAACFTGLLGLAFLPAKPDFADFIWRLALCGAGIGMFLIPNHRLIIGSAPANRMAAAGALVATSRMCGQTLGATLTSLLLAMGAGLGPTPALTAAGLMAVALSCNLVRLRTSLPLANAR